MVRLLLSAAAAVLVVPLAAGAGELSPLLLHPPRTEVVRPEVAVTARLSRPLDEKLRGALRSAGARFTVLPDGTEAAVGTVVSLQVRRERLRALAALPDVVRVEPALPLVQVRPLDLTGAQVGAHALWSPPAPGLPVTGEGVLVADHEGGWDPFHPDFFRPDGGLFDFVDVNGNGRAGEGDHVDLDGDGVAEAELTILHGARSDSYTGEVDFLEFGFQPDVDWLFVDLDGDGLRGHGAAGGFDDSAPALGEPIFVGDDVDGSGALEPGEKLVRLGSSKVRAIRVNTAGVVPHTYRRGVDLAAYPVADWDPSHGTGAIGIVAGGAPGLRRYTGIAPGADLLLVHSDDPVAGLALARQLGAQVNFYEWDSPIELHDGSSNFETALSEAAAEGSVQVAAAGNLAGADHCMQISPLLPGTSTARISIDDFDWYAYRAFWLNVTWTGPLDAVAFSLGDGASRLDVAGDYSEGTVGGIFLQAWTEHSSRGVSRVIVVATEPGGGLLPELELTASFTAAVEVGRLRGLLFDDQSGWGKGVSFLDRLTDEGSALFPSTADRVIAVGAYGGNHDLSQWGWGGLGERRAFSGVGPRIDGRQVVDLAAPDDPFSPRSDASSSHGAYAAFGGTSGALPHVAGSAALLLQARPDLGHDGVEAALTGSALADLQTGAVPNEGYGSGKLRVDAALLGASVSAGGPPAISLALRRPAVAGHEAIVEATVADPDGGELLVAWDVGYDRVDDAAPAAALTRAFTPAEAGPVRIVGRAIDSTGRSARALLLVEVGAPCEQAGCDEGCCGADGLCADCGGGGGGGAGGGAGGAGGEGAGGSGAGGSGAGGSGAGGSGAGGSGAGAGEDGGGSGASDGCGCTHGGSASGVALLLLAALAGCKTPRRRLPRGPRLR